jgi:hypothetical protein
VDATDALQRVVASVPLGLPGPTGSSVLSWLSQIPSGVHARGAIHGNRITDTDSDHEAGARPLGDEMHDSW